MCLQIMERVLVNVIPLLILTSALQFFVKNPNTLSETVLMWLMYVGTFIISFFSSGSYV